MVKKAYKNDIIILEFKNILGELGNMGKIKNGKRKKKGGKAFLKGILFFSFLSCGLLLFLTKSAFFNIKSVEVYGQNITLQESLQKKGERFLDESLLFIKTDEIKQALKENPYVENIKVKKNFPNKMLLEVEESDIAYYIGKGKSAYILSSKLRVLEQNKNGNLNGDIKNLIEIVGLEKPKMEIGERIVSTEDGVIENFCEELYKIKKANETKHKITKVDLSNISMIKIWFGRIEVRVGDGNELVEKINKVLNILENKEINIEKGYIDLSFNGSPIINRGMEA